MRQKPPEKMPGTHYLSVRDALKLYPNETTERTIRRWVAAGLLHPVYDRNKHLRIDAEELAELLKHKLGGPPALEQQVQSLMEQITLLEQRLAHLEQRECAREAQLQQVQSTLVHALAATPSHESTDAVVSLQEMIQVMIQAQISGPVGHSARIDPLEKRGLPPGTMRLVTWATLHNTNLHEIKKRSQAKEIQVTIYRRAEAERNAQEWWITPEQHRALALYIPGYDPHYRPCTDCVQAG